MRPRCSWIAVGAALTGCSGPPTDSQMGEICPIRNRTPLVDETEWAGPGELEVLETVASRQPASVDWDSQTLDSASSAVAVEVERTEEGPEVIERDCPDTPVYLRLPVVLWLEVAHGMVTGLVDGELWAEPDGTLSVWAGGKVEATEPWAGLGEAHVSERYGEGDIESWYAGCAGSWEAAQFSIEAKGTDVEGQSDFTRVLWRGHWVVSEHPSP